MYDVVVFNKPQTVCSDNWPKELMDLKQKNDLLIAEWRYKQIADYIMRIGPLDYSGRKKYAGEA